VVARNHQVLGVNRAVDSVIRQEALKEQIPIDQRLVHRVGQIDVADPPLLKSSVAEQDSPQEETIDQTVVAEKLERYRTTRDLPLIERAQPRSWPVGCVLAYARKRKIVLDAFLCGEGSPGCARQFLVLDHD
jgi:hypothetical protein